MQTSQTTPQAHKIICISNTVHVHYLGQNYEI